MTERMESTVRGRHGTKREGRKNCRDLTKSQISFILRCETRHQNKVKSPCVAEGKNNKNTRAEPWVHFPPNDPL